MGAVFLDILDRRMESTGLSYVRFMDDWIILAPTRWKLRKAIRLVCETLVELKVTQHPDKTFIGKINRGFDFLGYHISTDTLGLAEKTVTNFVERVSQLYEHGAGELRIGEYVRRWSSWVAAGLGTRLRAAATLGIVTTIGKIGLGHYDALPGNDNTALQTSPQAPGLNEYAASLHR